MWEYYFKDKSLTFTAFSLRSNIPVQINIIESASSVLGLIQFYLPKGLFTGMHCQTVSQAKQLFQLQLIPTSKQSFSRDSQIAAGVASYHSMLFHWYY